MERKNPVFSTSGQDYIKVAFSKAQQDIDDYLTVKMNKVLESDPALTSAQSMDIYIGKAVTDSKAAIDKIPDKP